MYGYIYAGDVEYSKDKAAVDIGRSLCGRMVPYKSTRYNSMAVVVRRCKICQKKLEEV